jgi:hypothetical protein
MAASLHSRLNDLASAFAANVLDVIRGSSLEELLAESKGRGRGASRPAAGMLAGGRRRGGRLPRRSTTDIKAMIDQIVALLRTHSKGLRAEQIRRALGIQAKELPRPLKEGLDGGRFHKSGQKRATTYFVKGARKAGSRAAERQGRAARTKRRKGGARRAKRSRVVEQKETVQTAAVEPSS